MKYEIIKMDNMGRGITYVDGLITFVPKTIIGDVIELEITKQKKKFNEARVINYIKRGALYKEAICPYYNKCGGCDLMNYKYATQLSYKQGIVKDLFLKYANTVVNPMVISKNQLCYRNKVTLQINDGIIGLVDLDYQVINIKYCNIAKESINNFIKELANFKVKNGKVVIRSNYNDELLIWFITKDDLVIPDLKDYKIAGIIKNNKVIVGDNNFIDKINNLFFKVSYDSFFQVNSLINEELFKIINDNLNENDAVLDLYCGVGTLSINASLKAREVIGIEIVPNAITDALLNKEMNKRSNIEFLLGDVKKTIDKVNKDFDAVIIDPPRSGIDQNSLNYILDKKIKKLIYVACDPSSLVRDYEKIKNIYNLKKLYLLDMFPNTTHCESVCVLERR